jgi:tRNA G46 methylase TrmB
MTCDSKINFFNLLLPHLKGFQRVLTPLGLFKFISDHLSYLEKINIFFNIITKKN